MMKAFVTPSVISGTITAPASKSSMQRACAAALIRTGETVIKNPGISNDDVAAIDVIQKLGAVVTKLIMEICILFQAVSGHKVVRLIVERVDLVSECLRPLLH